MTGMFRSTYVLIVIFPALTLANTFGQNQNGRGSVTEITRKSLDQAVILILGSHAVGKTSLIKQLTGSEFDREASSKDIIEYSYNVELENGIEAKLKLVNVPGIGEPNNLEEDVRVLGAVEEYLKNREGGKGNYPTVVLILSKFDDNRAEGVQSSFVKTLKGFQFIKSNFGDNQTESNIIFVMTHFMSIDREERRNPKNRIELFKKIIRNYTQFPQPIYMSVAENKPNDFGLEKDESGFYKLPNKELFPKNLLDQMNEIVKNTGDEKIEQILNFAFSKTFNNPEINRFNKTSNKYEKKYFQEFLNIEENEINLKLDEAFTSLRGNENISNLVKIQSALQSLNITTIDQIPSTESKIIELVKKLPITPITPVILSEAFSINIPVFTARPLVGFGFDLLKDLVLTQSPFEQGEKLYQSKIGLMIPSTLIVELEQETEEIFKIYSTNKEYFNDRVQSLVHSTANVTEFTIKPGYNVLDLNQDLFFTSVREIRKFSLELNLNEIKFNDNFKNTVGQLTPFNSSIRDSPKDWISFFNNFGTHVVRKAFGGGAMEVTANGPKLNLQENELISLKNYMLSPQAPHHGSLQIEKFSFLYNFLGGDAKIEMLKLNELPKEESKELLEIWETSLDSSTKMLENKFELIPIWRVVGLLDESKEQMVKSALDLHLQEQLKYIRVKKNQIPKIKFTNAPGIPTSSTTPPTSTTAGSKTIIAAYTHIQKEQNISKTTPQNGNDEQTDKIYNNTHLPTHPSNIFNSSPMQGMNNCKKVKEIVYVKERKGKLVGQGHNLLYDITLPTSPFKPDALFFTIENFPKTKTRDIFEKMTNIDDYIYKRIQNLDRYFLVTDKYFRGELKPGYYIETNKGLLVPGATVYREAWNQKKILTGEMRKDYFNSEFLQALDELPGNSNSSEKRREYFNFFKTYGTHVVTSANIGLFMHTTYGGFSLEQKRVKNLLPIIDITSFPSQNLIELGYDITLIRMDEIVRKIKPSMYFSFNEALRDYVYSNAG